MIDEGRVSFSVPDAVLRERVPLHAEREKEIAEFQKFIRDCRSTEQIPIYRFAFDVCLGKACGAFWAQNQNTFSRGY
jgi:hypothetical protein